LASNNPFFEPLGGDGRSLATPKPSNVFVASALERQEHPSPFSLDDESDKESAKVPGSGGRAVSSVWAAVFSSLPQAVVVLDDQQKILYTNSAHAELLGVDAARTGKGMDDWFRKVCPDSEKMSKVLASWHEHIWRNQLTRTFALTSATKGVRHIEFRSSISQDGNTIIFQSDVTDQIAVDEALRQANLKFRNIFGNSTGGIVVVNREGVIHDLNQAFAEFAGKSARELIGKPFLDLLNLEDAAALRTSEAGNLKDFSEAPRKLRFTFEGQERDRPALVTASYILSKEGEVAFKLYQLRPRDTQLLAKLHELSAKAQSLLDAVPNMFVLLDRDGRIKDWSPPAGEWEVTLDFTAESVGQLAQVIWPAFGKMLEAHIEEVFSDGQSFRQDITHGREKVVFPVTLSPFGKDLALALIEAPSSPGEGLMQRWQSHFFANATEAVLVVTNDGDVIDANPACSKLLGQSHGYLTRSNLFQLLSRAPGSREEFDARQLQKLSDEKKWSDLLSISPSGPQAVSARITPVKDDKAERLPQLVVIIQTKQVDSLSEVEVMELVQAQFRSQLQTITSLFSITSESRECSSFVTWLVRLKVLAESMTSSKRVGVVNLLRDIADQVSSAAGRGLGAREVVISGSRSLTIENEIATPFALFAGEVMSLAVCGTEKGRGPSVFIDVESYEGNILLTAKPGEGRKLFSSEKMENAQVIEILVEQIRGKISIGVGDDNMHTTSLRLTFPCQQS